ncbi:hypothetical protein BOTBODRAFT_199296 [Botryobasidium botryosum FD-172 SS1]|uniref:Uncharacterized protein n=1 Tax=Botryobasidium botryosum (strain FD-172 SS1) TaxID=930990 RepID=A0A067N331_BOTB1|nr:hypothetical protein BOTBODRAFT_199296 [Botryobasidium botryosum FD-172 SS1]
MRNGGLISQLGFLFSCAQLLTVLYIRCRCSHRTCGIWLPQPPYQPFSTGHSDMTPVSSLQAEQDRFARYPPPRPNVVVEMPTQHVNCAVDGLTTASCAGVSYLLVERVMPTLTIVNACSFGIFMLCLTILGYQDDATIGVINESALSAVVIACLSSGITLFLGLAHSAYKAVVCPASRHCGHFISRLIHATACASLLAASTSFAVFVAIAALKTSPRISKPYFILSGCVIAGLLFAGIVYHGVRRPEWHRACYPQAGATPSRSRESQSATPPHPHDQSSLPR